MKTILTLFAVIVFLAPLRAQEIGSLQQFEDRYETFLQTYTVEGLVDYKSLKNDNKDLRELLSYLSNENLEPISDQNKASLINGYNLNIIAAVVRHYPISSPLDQADFFTNKFVKLNGKTLSLDDLEKKILFKNYPDYRLHFVLVCAALGCPKLPNHAFTADQLERQLETATKKSIGSNILVQYSVDDNTLSLSELFSWYLKDFGGTEQKLLKLIQKYSAETIPDNVKIDFTKYNWALNTK